MVVYLAVFLLGMRMYRCAEQPVIDGAARRGGASLDGEERLVETEEVDGHGEGLFLVKLLPIWVTSIVFAAVISQVSTLFTKQGSTMDRFVGGLVVPSAALQCFVSGTYIALVPVYDRAVVPLARRLTGGITMLHRVGAGMATSCLATVVAALVEARRLRAARDASLVDWPDATVPMGEWWLVPQHVLVGVAEMLGLIGWRSSSTTK
ncbi:hypothetical protein E2562_015188 [Oryza meyeriana var. granulata]|uniref:Uncharacterized protein n=1 Tax=Oryza meyeriana var. granulata TaxID=110450 RepID=A0A6G1EWP3_9ORYZ|nr:hypothetical protein E2562_015188 [Oryza meyeriana var. granulata]